MSVLHAHGIAAEVRDQPLLDQVLELIDLGGSASTDYQVQFFCAGAVSNLVSSGSRFFLLCMSLRKRGGVVLLTHMSSCCDGQKPA